MTLFYDYSACDSCEYGDCCVFDNISLSKSEQDAKCPAATQSEVKTPNVHPGPNSLGWVSYRHQKLSKIQGLIDEKGPLLLVDIPPLADVPLATVRQWRHSWFEIESRKIMHSGRYIPMLFVTAVIEREDQSNLYETARNNNLKAIADLIENEGPLPIRTVAKRLGIEPNTLRTWVKNRWYMEIEIKRDAKTGRNIKHISGLQAQ